MSVFISIFFLQPSSFGLRQEIRIPELFAYRNYIFLKARKRLAQILGEIIRERREKRSTDKELLGQLLSCRDPSGETLTDEQITDNIIGVLFAAQDTTASALTWILKYLHDHQKLLESVKVQNHSATNYSLLRFSFQMEQNLIIKHISYILN